MSRRDRRWEHETAAGRHDHELRARVVTRSPLGLARLRCERGSVDVVQARWLPKKRRRSHGDHRYGYSSLVRAGGVQQDGQIKREQRVELVRDQLIKLRSRC